MDYVNTVIQVHLLLIQTNAMLGKWEACKEMVEDIPLSSRVEIAKVGLEMAQKLRNQVEN